MADSARLAPRHAATVRLTHWLTTVSFFALLLSGVEILISHPRFYWGETGNVLSHPLFSIPIPASRGSVPTAYGFVLPDQNGWSRYLHFQSAWVLVLTGLLYVTFALLTSHFRGNLLPAPSDLKQPGLSYRIADANSYNAIQRLTYLFVIFVLAPLVIWTGLAMSPAIASAFPSVVTLLGGQQSARTLHFFITIALVVFVLGHLVMIVLAGFRSRVRAMLSGRAETATREPA